MLPIHFLPKTIGNFQSILEIESIDNKKINLILTGKSEREM